MHTFQKRLIATASIVIAAAVAAYWYWSPYLVMHQMQSAARAADADSFSDHVDYPQLRESLKGQISTRLTAEMAGRSNSGNAFEQAGNALGSMLGLALVDRMIDAVVRPEMVMRAMESGKFQPKTDGRKAEESKESAAQADIAVLSQAVRLYRLDHGVCPSEAQGLAILTDPNAGLNGRGAYLGKLPVDPWGRPYQYANPGKGSEEFDITHLPPPKDEQSSPTKRMAWRTERKGFDKIFIYVDPDGAPSKKSEVAFVMRREGFANWRLTEIRLPD